MRLFNRISLLLMIGGISSACAPLLIAGATETAVVVAQERSVGMAIDDTGILINIKRLYNERENNELFLNVEIKVVEGRVLLTGNVDSPQSQIDAVNLAWQAKGVKEVINEIQVNDKSGFANYAQDVWISTQIRTRLLFTKGIQSVNYSIITVNQKVYIMGIAQDQAELARVTQVASTTKYVQKVVSYVTMKDDPRREPYR